ncbi:hypothetical protein STENM36S_09361 [Streptomyces tendae]
MRSTTAGGEYAPHGALAVAPGKWDQTIYHLNHIYPRTQTGDTCPGQRPVRATPASRPPVPAPAARAGLREARAPTRTARPPSAPASGRPGGSGSASAPGSAGRWAGGPSPGWARGRGSRRSAAVPRSGGRPRVPRRTRPCPWCFHRPPPWRRPCPCLCLCLRPSPSSPCRARPPRAAALYPAFPPETAGPPPGASPPRSPAECDGLPPPPDSSSPTLMQPAAAATARAVAARRTGRYKGRTGGHLRGSRSRRAQLPSPTRGHAPGEADLTRALHPYPGRTPGHPVPHP